jgi:hypothetical protein
MKMRRIYEKVELEYIAETYDIFLFCAKSKEAHIAYS